MKYFVAFAVLILAAVALAESRPQDVEAPKGAEVPQGVEAPKENLKGAEAAYLAYPYATYPALAYSAYPYVIPPAGTVLLRR